MQQRAQSANVIARNVEFLVDDQACNPLALGVTGKRGLLLVNLETVLVNQLTKLRADR